MMKKVMILVAMLCMGVMFLAGCGNKTEAPEGDAPDASAEKVVIKLAHVEADDGTLQPSSLAFKEYVETESKGTMEVQVYPNAELGGDRQATEGVALGTIQMSLPATSVMTMYDPAFGLLDMPFIFKNTQAAYAALDGELGEKLNEKLLAVGIHTFGYPDNGVRHMTNNVRPITEPADLKGVKMRVMESPVYIEMFKNLGTNAVPMSYGELYTALQQKTVDGEENSLSNINSAKFYEVQKYLSLTGHTMGFDACIINEEFYQGLSPEHKKIVDDGVKTHLIDGQRAMQAEQSNSGLEVLKEKGMEANEITPENHQKFVDAVQPMYETLEAEIGAEFFELVAKYNDQN